MRYIYNSDTAVQNMYSDLKNTIFIDDSFFLGNCTWKLQIVEKVRLFNI